MKRRLLAGVRAAEAKILIIHIIGASSSVARIEHAQHAQRLQLLRLVTPTFYRYLWKRPALCVLDTSSVGKNYLVWCFYP